MKFIVACCMFGLLLSAGCTPKAVSSSEVPSGTWSGDYGPDPDRRDPVTLDLRWENTATLRGTVHAGPRDIELRTASFKPETGAITMEFEAQANGRPVHYVIDGKVEGNQMKGSWGHDEVKGDFHLTRQ